MKNILKNTLFNIFIALLTIVTFSACTKEVEPEPEKADLENLTLIHTEEIEEEDLKVSLYAYESFFAGYNEVFFVLEKLSTEELIEEAHVHMRPLMEMEMGSMEQKMSMSQTHSAPAIHPEISKERKGTFAGGIIFTMPSADMATWTLHLTISGIEGREIAHELMFEVPVTDKDASYQTQDASYHTLIRKVIQEQTHFFAYRFPGGKPEIGANPFEMIVYKQIDAMTFEPVNDLTITIDPQMPTMGHGSPNNEQPVFTSNGVYTGKVNFTMTGDWAIWLKATQNDQTILEEQAFYLEF